jgi:ribosomal protein L32
MEWVVIWVIGAIVAGVIGDRKGRHGGLWALAALFLSPLVVLIVLALPSLKGKQERRAAESGRSKHLRVCPACAEVVRREALVCKHCGKDLPPAPPVKGFFD